MCTLDRIKSLLKQQKKTQQDLCRHLGVSKQAFTEWNGGRNASYKKYLPQIADYFGVTIDYLLGDADAQKEKTPPITDEALKFALFGGDQEIPDELLEEVKRFAAYAKEKYGKK